MFRATSGTIALIVSGVIALLLLVDALLRAGIGETLLLAPWILLAVWLVYLLMYASHLSIGRDGVIVQNYLRRTVIPWARVSDIRMHWQVVFTLGDGSEVKAYGGPIAGRPARVRPGSDAKAVRVPPALRETDEIREAGEMAREEAPRDAAVARGWDLPAVIALAVIAVGAVAAVLAVV